MKKEKLYSFNKKRFFKLTAIILLNIVTFFMEYFFNTIFNTIINIFHISLSLSFWLEPLIISAIFCIFGKECIAEKVINFFSVFFISELLISTIAIIILSYLVF